jgi:hypothetical protein
MYEGSLVAKNSEIKTTLDQLNKFYNDQAPYAKQRLLHRSSKKC